VSPIPWLLAIASKVQKIKLREEKGSVKFCVLDSNNRDVERDSSDESETKESSDLPANRCDAKCGVR